jgi:hypothetical protein
MYVINNQNIYIIIKKWCISNSNIAKIYAHDGEHSNEFKKKVRKGGQNNVHDVATLEFFDAMEHLMKLLEPSKIACRYSQI